MMVEHCDNTVKYTRRKKRWYSSDIFPLVPVITTRRANEHNTSSFSFKWLFFTVWSLDAFEFEVTVVCDAHWGIGVVGVFPYIRWVVCIPCPYRLQYWVQRNLWRRPKVDQNPERSVATEADSSTVSS